MKKQFDIFFNALSFFTRIPCPNWVSFSKDYQQKSIAYFAFIGILVGSFAALVLYLSLQIVPHSIAVLLSMISTIYVTGAFHEDGFADVCDGLGGGWTKNKILSIMKDSQIGAYGAIGVLLVLLLKFFCLYEMPKQQLFLVIIAGHSISRLLAAALVYTLPYVSSSSTSKSEVRASSMSVKALVCNVFFGLTPLLLFKSLLVFLTLIPVIVAFVYMRAKFKKWLGGQTGDCAGATQQTCEVVFYLSFLVLWKFI